MITNTPGRKIRSRELKACRFSFGHFRRKSRHSPRPGTGYLPEKLPFPPLLPPALHHLWGCYAANAHLSFEKIPLRASTQLFNLQPLHLQTEGPWKAEKTDLSCPLSQERFRSNHVLLGDQPVNLFLDCSFIRELLNLCSHRWHELTDFPGPNPARSTLRPLLGLKPGLSSHKLTRSHTLNPGLPLESPGALPTKHTDGSTGPRENSVGRALVAYHWPHDPDGHHLAKDSFWTISVNRNPWSSGPHSKRIWLCRSTVGPWNESLASSLFFLMFLPPNPHSGALRSSPHTHHTWDLSVGEDLRGNFWERSKLESGRESTWGSAFIHDPGWSALGSPGWVWISPFKPRQAGFWWALSGCHWRGPVK